jgi:UDP-3-O-[3-hydroxymyristoyl] glucosamine N-acyltransferase LpxD
MIQPITINGIEITPDQIRYDSTGVWLGDEFTPSDNSRLKFTRLLNMFTDDGRMYAREGSAVHDRVEYDVRRVRIGCWCVIGGVGFGYENDESGVLIPMPHLGGVVIEDGVVIHNNVCIDRAVTGNTMIGEGSKIDNLVHVAHGVRVGRRCLVVAGVVLGGRCEIGDYTFIGMNASVKQHCKVGRNCVIGSGAVVTKDIPDNQIWVGNPAKYLKDTEARKYLQP